MKARLLPVLVLILCVCAGLGAEELDTDGLVECIWTGTDAVAIILSRSVSGIEPGQKGVSVIGTDKGLPDMIVFDRADLYTMLESIRPEDDVAGMLSGLLSGLVGGQKKQSMYTTACYGAMSGRGYAPGSHVLSGMMAFSGNGRFSALEIIGLLAAGGSSDGPVGTVDVDMVVEGEHFGRRIPVNGTFSISLESGAVCVGFDKGLKVDGIVYEKGNVKFRLNWGLSGLI